MQAFHFSSSRFTQKVLSRRNLQHKGGYKNPTPPHSIPEPE
jgi:hypothetical protein